MLVLPSTSESTSETKFKKRLIWSPKAVKTMFRYLSYSISFLFIIIILEKIIIMAYRRKYKPNRKYKKKLYKKRRNYKKKTMMRYRPLGF